MFHLTLIFTTFGTLAAIKRSNGAQQHLMAATDSLLEAIEKTEDAIDDQMLAVLEGSVNGNRAVPIDFAQHMSSLLSQPSSSEAEAPQQERVSGSGVALDVTNIILLLGMLLMGVALGVAAVAYREKVITCLEALPLGKRTRKFYMSRRETFRKAAVNPPFLHAAPMTESPVESA
ncbi:hypothetical protein Pmar_PMAR025651 [Perkinsus marinus ATCC 50983]|uniref:Uncharacterized protein n=1 Tax=Perkinsus marinus (strain ATCC 50983 / TXsc) TaxID=423536 RepID=C5KIM3_PERM5|nr:hypothetical protein Pmar_PMAR025651 [Perkinsus marinus ATCC 50983]EER15638.1 hypothetical protein Pmar_PMAR025651 [Perkinsus marinus ATCC 50983]|eukprot:XP_002783842.1 hypothetical protein Pmar_PMAR025651 [Perkinsus marinus ATCC 50983]